METLLKRLLALKIRRKRRFKVKKGVSVVLGGSGSIGKNQINDIGMGGLSFYYTDNGQPITQKAHNVSLIQDGRPTIFHIPCRTICDAETGELIFPNQRVKRRSVKFDRLSIRQKKQVKQLIKDFAVKR